MKRHMRKVNQIEAVLNSRPLYPMPSDPNDPTPLTPAHFLIGESLLTLPLLRLIHCKWVVISRHNNDLKIEDTSSEAEC